MDYNVDIKKISYSYENTPSIANKYMFYYLQSCGYFNCNENYYTNRANYNSFLLLYTLNGTGYLTYRDKTYVLKKNQLFIIDCNENQFYRTDKCDLWKFKFIHFNGSQSKDYVERIIENNGAVSTLIENSIVPKNINKIINLAKTYDERIDIISSCLIVEILTELLLSGTHEDLSNDFIPQYVKKAINIIETNYSTQLNLDDIAQQINISKFYLTKLMKKYTGHSLYEYLINYRLTKSKELLKSTEIPIKDISESVGFDNESHFIKIFKQNECTTPLQFRKYFR